MELNDKKKRPNLLYYLMFHILIQQKYSNNLDPKYGSVLLSKFVNRIIHRGKKSISYRILYAILHKIRKTNQGDPVAILEHAIRTVMPGVKLKTRRVGGAVYQIPVEVDLNLRISLAIRWILKASITRSGKSLIFRLSDEILDAACGLGGAVRKRDEVYRIAEANKAFVRYRA